MRRDGTVGTNEIELKFALDAAAAATAKQHGLLAGKQPSTTRFVSVYFDTDDHGLRKQRASLRLRKTGDKVVQTVKQRIGGSHGLFIRDQLEIPITGDSPDLAPLRARLSGPLQQRLAEPLRPLFRVEMERTEWRFVWNGSMISVAIDEGFITDGCRSEPLHELEVELRAGEIGSLFAVARLLAEAAALRPEPESKADRGYRLVRSAAIEPRIAG